MRDAEGVIVIGDNACPMFTDRTTANVTDTLGHALVTAQQTDQQHCSVYNFSQLFDISLLASESGRLAPFVVK